MISKTIGFRTTAYRIPAEGPEQFPAALEGKGQEEGGWDETTKALLSCHENVWKTLLLFNRTMERYTHF